MRNAKKLLGLAMAFCMILALSACGSTDEGSDSSTSTTQTNSETGTETNTEATENEQSFEGMNLTVWGVDFKQWEDLSKGVNDNATTYHAINEWCEMNGCTWENVVSADANVMLSMIAAGQSPDLYYRWAHFPLWANTGTVASIDEYYDDFVEKFSDFNVDQQALVHKGSVYGFYIPWGPARVIQYDRTLFDEMGVKTPREYYEEGSWTWDNFRTCLQEITRDTDADGVKDIVGIGKNRMVAFINEFNVNEDGTIASDLNSERNREFFQMLYEEFTLNGTVIEDNTMTVGLVNSLGVYSAMATANVVYTNPSQLLTVNADGHVLECVPVPRWKAEDPDYGTIMNEACFMIPSGAQNMDASMSLLEYIFECGLVEMAKDSQGLLECSYTGLQGITEGSAAYIELAEETRAEAFALTQSLPEYDPEFMSMVIEDLAGTTKRYICTYQSVTGEIPKQKDFSILWTMPSATSIAEAYELHQSQCDTYNKNFIY